MEVCDFCGPSRPLDPTEHSLNTCPPAYLSTPKLVLSSPGFLLSSSSSQPAAYWPSNSTCLEHIFTFSHTPVSETRISAFCVSGSSGDTASVHPRDPYPRRCWTPVARTASGQPSSSSGPGLRRLGLCLPERLDPGCLTHLPNRRPAALHSLLLFV